MTINSAKGNFLFAFLMFYTEHSPVICSHLVKIKPGLGGTACRQLFLVWQALKKACKETQDHKEVRNSRYSGTVLDK